MAHAFLQNGMSVGDTTQASGQQECYEMERHQRKRGPSIIPQQMSGKTMMQQMNLGGINQWWWV
jgi:hypothetical protein